MDREGKKERCGLSTVPMHILDGATRLPNLEPAALSSVARALAEHGQLVVAECDPATNVVTFYARDEWVCHP